MNDAEDPCPNANTEKMDKKCRGICRALAYFQHNTGESPFWWEGKKQTFPFDALFLVKTDDGDIAFVPSADTYGISVSGKTAKAELDELLEGYNDDSCINISIDTAEELAAAKKQQEEASKNPGADSSSSCSSADTEVDPQLLEASTEGYGYFPDGSAYVSFSFATSGYMVVLAEIDGEFYPISCDMTWIS